MRKMSSVAVAVVAAAVYCLSFSDAMAKDEAIKINAAPKAVKDDAVKISNAYKVVKEIAAIPKRKIPPVLLNGASAIIIVAKAAKQDFMTSGGSAGGVLLVHDTEGTWSSPVFITLSGGTLGWQIISAPLDIILVFNNRRSVDAILKGKFTMDAKIAIQPGRLGLNMNAATARELKAEIASYVRSRGTFEEANVAGAAVQIDAAANDAFYAKPKVDAGDIVSGKVVNTSGDIKALQKLLADYAAAR